jgi:hypothetical protein
MLPTHRRKYPDTFMDNASNSRYQCKVNAPILYLKQNELLYVRYKNKLYKQKASKEFFLQQSKKQKNFYWFIIILNVIFLTCF